MTASCSFVTIIPVWPMAVAQSWTQLENTGGEHATALCRLQRGLPRSRCLATQLQGTGGLGKAELKALFPRFSRIAGEICQNFALSCMTRRRQIMWHRGGARGPFPLYGQSMRIAVGAASFRLLGVFADRFEIFLRRCAMQQNRTVGSDYTAQQQQQHVRHVRVVELNRDTASCTTVRVAGMSLSPLCLDYLSITPTEVIRPRTRVFRKMIILPQSAMWFVSCIFNDPWSASIFACMIGHWLSIHGAIETAQL